MRELYCDQQELWSGASTGDAPRVATLLSTNRPHCLERILTILNSQVSVDLELLVATHGFRPSREILEFVDTIGLDVTWIQADQELSLGEVYNLVLEQVTAPYVAKIDDDDFYGATYLIDSIHQLEASGAGIVGKDCIFVYDMSSESVFIRMENKHHRFVYSVAGGTIVTRSSTARQIGFISETVGEDQDFLRRAFAKGVSLYSTSPFGFVLSRGTENTWNPDDSFLKVNARVIGRRRPGPYECVIDPNEETDV